MKQFSEMSNAELKERLNFLKEMEGTEELCNKIEAELKSREMNKEKSAMEKEKALRSKQHDILGKYYQIGDVYYKVVGVLFEKVFLEYVASGKLYGRNGSCKFYTIRSIDEVMLAGKETDGETYMKNAINVNQTITDIAQLVNDMLMPSKNTFNDWMDAARNWTSTIRF